MFSLRTSAFGPYTQYQLFNDASGHGFSVVPEVGATLLSLTFKGNNVLDGYDTPEALGIGKWGKSAILFPFPNRLRDGCYTWHEKEYQFPLNNAATNNAIHGFLRSEPWVPVRIELTEESAELTCRYDYKGERAYYPFPFVLEVTFAITQRNDFNVTFWLRNQHTAAIPMGLGWHPYFRLTEKADDHSLQLPSSERVLIDERMLPTGERTETDVFLQAQPLESAILDQCFHVSPLSPMLYRLQLRHGQQGISLAASRAQFPYFQVFTPPARQSVALEPMTCNVNAFQNGDGLVSLEAGADWMGAFRVEYAS